MKLSTVVVLVGCLASVMAGRSASGEEPQALPKASIDGTGLGWKQLGEADFVDVNGLEETWTFDEKGGIHCTGQPVGVIRTAQSVPEF